MVQRIFISSVQREFAKERKALAEMIRKDMLLGTEDIVRKCKAWGLRDPEYHPSSVDFRLVLWRQEVNVPHDFTQVGEVGEVGSKGGVESNRAKGVESDAKSPIKSRVCGGSRRLHPHPLEWVKSVGEVGLPLHEQILVFVAESPRKSSEITEFLGMSRVYGNIARCLNALLDDKLIELTIPEKPRSRLQRYRVTRKGRQVAKLLAQSNRAAATLKEE